MTLDPETLVTVDGQQGLWRVAADGVGPCAGCEEEHDSYDTLLRVDAVGVLYHVCEHRVSVAG